MQQEYAHLNYFELHDLLIYRNKEFTQAIKAGKKQEELQSIYEGIQTVYSFIRSQKMRPPRGNR